MARTSGGSGGGGIAAPDTYTLEETYGAPASGDVTTELQNAVNDILLTKGGGRLQLEDRVYNFDAITWPLIDRSQPTPALEIVGPFAIQTVGYMPGVGLTLAQGADMPAPSKGAILESSLASGSAFGGLTDISNFLVKFRDVIVRVPPNPQWHGIDAGWALNMITEGVVVDQGRSWGDGSNPLSPGPIVQPTNTGTYGIIYPGPGNGGVVRARDVLVCGYYNGLIHSEHFDGDRITLAKNVIGYRPRDAWHASRIGRLSTYWNTYDIQPINQGGAGTIGQRIQIDEWDTEEDAVGGNWYTTIYHLNDPNNFLFGRVNVHRMVPNAGVSSFILRRGGAYLRDRMLSAPRELIDSVGFEGANSATALPASRAGQPAQQVGGTWGIDAQRAYLATVATENVAAWDFGVNQFVLSTRLKTHNVNTFTLNTGLALFVADANNLMFVSFGPTTATLQKISAGTWTTLVTSAAYTGIALGEEITIQVRVVGKTIQVYYGDTLIISYTMTAAEWTAYSPNTSHGFFAYGGGFEPGGVNGSHWDHLRIDRAGAIS